MTMDLENIGGQALEGMNENLEGSSLSSCEKDYLQEAIESGDNQLLTDRITELSSDASLPKVQEIVDWLEQNGMDVPEQLSDNATESLEQGVLEQYSGQEGLDWLKENNPEAYEMASHLFEPESGRAFEDSKYWLPSFSCKELEDGSIEMSMTDELAEPSKITVRGDEVYANSGCVQKADSWAPNMFLDETLSNKTYHIDDNSTFKTDEFGRTVFAEQDRTMPIEDTKTNLDEDRRAVLSNLKGGLDSSVEDAGHILQKSQGGINECINLVPMDSEWQRPGGEWRALEAREESAISEAQANGAESIISRRNLDYEGDSQRPSSILFETIIDGEKVISEKIECPSSNK